MATPWRAIGGKFRNLLAAAKSSTAAAAATSAAPKAAKSAKRSPAAASGAVNRETGIMKAVPVSPTLGQFLGSSEASRTEAIKKVWDHIKANGLQNPSNKKEILCDEAEDFVREGEGWFSGDCSFALSPFCEKRLTKQARAV